MTGAQAAGSRRPRSRRRRRLGGQGPAGRRPACRSPGALCRAGRQAPAAGVADRVPLPARRRRGRRGGPGRVRQGLLAPGDVSRRAAVRGLVHADPDQRVPGPHQGADAAGTLDHLDAGRPRRRAGFRGADARARAVAGGSAARAGNGGRQVADALAKLPGPAAVGVHAEPLRGLHARGRSARSRG